ncbi:uncharacterized protein [Typha angustifolia]|uniref:uncharacterized protein n=1 Tax=Typha angustifolia TaxID=59011 RepID=UPI003C2F7D7E
MSHGSKLSSQDLGKLSNEGHGEASKQQQHESNSPPQPPQPHKKQVRRRLHTSRPYQQRLLNMAEARREIVTALKIHRASMKQANEQQQKLLQQNSTPTQASHASLPYSGGNITSPPPPPKYSFSNYLFNSQFSPYITSPLSYSYPSITPPIPQNLDIPLPNQLLGLNLNVQGFNSIDASFCSGQNKSSPTTASYSYSSPLMSNGEISTASNTSPQTSHPPLDPVSTILHPAMDDKEMAEIQSIGEQHDMEWNDAVNSVSSVCWSKFLKNMESDQRQEGIEGDGFSQLNEVFDTSSWLCDGFDLESNENIFQQQPENRYNPESYPENDTLPCLDIGEIEGWDGAWLL